jgi:Arc/MetJ family transcription regulator
MKGGCTMIHSTEELRAKIAQYSKKKETVQIAVRDLTESKISEAEKRISEIDRKIEKLQEERENLIRKNENRRKALIERS